MKEPEDEGQAEAALLAIGYVLEFTGQPMHQTAHVGEVCYLVIGTPLRKGGEQWGAYVRPTGSTKAPVWCGYKLPTRDDAKAACQRHLATGSWY